MLGLSGCGRFVHVGNQKLLSYRESSGGGMSGGGRSTEVWREDGVTYLTYISQKYWYSDNIVTEFRVSDEVLSEIESVFKKNGLSRWNNKKFTNMFIADGESDSYDFDFDRGASVSFSSQYYPLRCQRVLKKFRTILSECRGSAVPLPGLQVKEYTEEELVQKTHPDNKKVEAEVYEYSRGELYYRILNGTDEDAALPGNVRLIRQSDGAVLFSEEDGSGYSFEVNAHGTDAKSIKPEKRLEEGEYTLEIGSDFSVDFTIAPIDVK